MIQLWQMLGYIVAKPGVCSIVLPCLERLWVAGGGEGAAGIAVPGPLAVGGPG